MANSGLYSPLDYRENPFSETAVWGNTVRQNEVGVGREGKEDTHHFDDDGDDEHGKPSLITDFQRTFQIRIDRQFQECRFPRNPDSLPHPPKQIDKLDRILRSLTSPKKPHPSPDFSHEIWTKPWTSVLNFHVAEAIGRGRRYHGCTGTFGG